MARTKQQQPIRQSKPLMVRQSKRLISKENKKLDREFTRFVEGIVNEKFKGTKFDSEAVVALWEGAEVWMEHYEGASAEKKKQLVAVQNSALEHSLNNIEEHSLDYIEKRAVEAQEAQTLAHILKQMDAVAEYCECIGLKGVYLARP